jgi:NitT/TauT family transport system permease protein
MADTPHNVWGSGHSATASLRRFRAVDLLIVVSLAGILYGVIELGREWTAPHRESFIIDLSPWALPQYTFFSLCRGLMAYALSLGFTLVYGYWAAKDAAAERILIPMLDILQSIPVLGFMPGLVLAVIALFPRSNVGLELAAVIMIFTGQAWNMTFSFYHSLKGVPQEMREAAAIYRMSWWQRFKWVELPFSMLGLVWNSMMSMAGGWFFLTSIEAFRLGEEDYRLPGIGAYMSEAVDKGDYAAMVWAVLAMMLMILLVDQLLWRPVVAWAQKFRVEEGGEAESVSSWFLNWLRQSRDIARVVIWVRHLFGRRRFSLRPRPMPSGAWARLSSIPILTRVPLVLLLAILAFGAWKLVWLLSTVAGSEWLHFLVSAGWTLGRVMLAVVIGTLWTVPAGIVIGLSPRLSRILQPFVQQVASFPAPMLFPAVILVLDTLRVSFEWGSVVLMLLGTQWYILFNVIAGTMAIPADLREMTKSFRIPDWQRFRTLYLPGIFPYLVTGWVTAAGGAWNASIVSEYATFRGATLTAHGLGAEISEAAAGKHLPQLAAAIIVMSAVVVLFNRTLWRKCYNLAETKFSLNK